MDITPITPKFGADIRGLDLARPLDDADFATVRRAVVDFRVAVIHDVKPDVLVLRDFCGRFGRFLPHILSQYHHPDASEIAVITNNPATGMARATKEPAGSFWHADLSYERRPADFSFLYSVEVPAQGGDTRFADTMQAYDTLPDDLKRRLEGMTAVHRYGGTKPPPSIVTLTPEQRAAHPDVAHPVVRTIPETGRKYLYVSPGYTVNIVGLPEVEGAALLERLYAHILKPEFAYRHKWRPGQIVVADNRATIHSATPDYPPTAMRTLYRMFVAADAA
jgi:taurine dioxygenase